MKILFSPSEEKNLIYKDKNNSYLLFMQSLLFNNLYNFRKDVLNQYLDFLINANSNDIARILGSKKVNLDILSACNNIPYANTIESIFLYNGVAFKALDINTLPKDSVDYLLNNVIIFSNLFGAIRAKDKIPYYKLKQNEKFGKYNISSFYNGFKNELDKYLKNEEVLDLRAEIYIKAYSPNIPTTIVEFYKNNKKVSHHSKLYRGILLREIALKKQLDICNLDFKNFKLCDVKKIELKTILKYEII
ncbi:peroxide stress protein YaaA [Helicobacter sp. MIT 14-3879]|uniref:peroxide stress protein YaaA n=1 Tax=Helicobacter sp. MIT 14-3879 TaxID=2040649 RepID=UPI000E1E9D55|nr:peroxide stress protein YaaA [Helicobacter sp. MIT 14-3879]RDU62420.1 peroxide stress protein YaaA [Helicobacter sp. MIT 14-3879]